MLGGFERCPCVTGRTSPGAVASSSSSVIRVINVARAVGLNLIVRERLSCRKLWRRSMSSGGRGGALPLIVCCTALALLVLGLARANVEGRDDRAPPLMLLLGMAGLNVEGGNDVAGAG